MTFDRVQEYDETPSGNTAVASINIDEGMAPSDVNNAIRAFMSHIRKWNLGPSFISGIAPSNDSDADHDISFSIGSAADSTGVQMIHNDSALVKQIDVNWAAGTAAGGFPSGLTLTADTWYYLFVLAIPGTGVVDAGFDTSLTAANLITDAAAYTLFRRVGSVLTDGSSNIIAFTALETAGGGLDLLWTDPPLDLSNQSITTTASTHTLSVPTGYQVNAHIRQTGTAGAGSPLAYISSPDVNDEAPSATAGPLFNAMGNDAIGADVAQELTVRTNTSGQVRARSASTANIYLVTFGWEDYRR